MMNLAILAEVEVKVDGLMDQILMYGIPLIGSVTLAYAIFNLIMDLRKPEARRVAQRLRETASGLPEGANDQSARESLLRRQKENSAIGATLSKMGVIAKLQTMLDQADLQWNAPTVLLNIVGLSAVSYVACYFLVPARWVGIAVAAALILLPLLAVFIKLKLRLNKFLNQLPDVFELMSQGLRAGHSLANAILLVSQQLPNPVGIEFARVFHEQNLGLKIEDALKNMAKRVGLMDVKFFVTAVLIQRQTGGDLAEVLDNISGVIRERIKLFGQVKALTAEGRLSGWLLLALPVVVFLVELVINPKYANLLLDEELGQYMLIGAGISQILGLALIQKIVNIKV